MSTLKDTEIFKDIVSAQKKGIKKDENIPSLMNRIIHIIRNKNKPCSLSELEKETKLKELASNKKFMRELLRSNKIRFDDKTEMLSLKSIYGISNLEELKAKIRESENGLPEDDELNDVYPGVKNDIEKLKAENYIRVIENTDKANILFYRDASDKFEERLINPDYQSAICLLRKIWKDDLKYYNTGEKTQVYLKKRKFSEELVHKLKKKRKITKTANEHIYSDMFK